MSSDFVIHRSGDGYFSSSCRNTLKAGASALSFFSVIPYAPIASEFPSEKIPFLGNLFAGGEIVAWSVFYSNSAFEIIYQIDQDFGHRVENLEEKKGKAYWISIIAYGILSQFPGGYVIYHYNGSLFYTIISPLVYSFFSIHSLHGFFSSTEISCNLRRRPSGYLFTNDPVSLRRRLRFSLDCCRFILLNGKGEQSAELRRQIEQVLMKPTIDVQDLRFLKDKGLAIAPIMEESLKRKVELVRKYVGGSLGFVISLFKPGLEGYLTYKGLSLEVEEYLSVFLAVLATTPMVYLAVYLNRKMFDQYLLLCLRNSTRTISTDFRGSGFPTLRKIAMRISPFVCFFGMGSTFTVLRNEYGFSSFLRGMLSALTPVSIYSVLLKSMHRAINTSLDRLSVERISPEEARLYLSLETLENLERRISYLPDRIIYQIFSEDELELE